MSNLIQKKICLLGDFSVGKTSLIRRYVENFFDENYISTIGVNITRKDVDLIQCNTLVRFLIWDLAGAEKFNGAHTSYLQGAAGALIVADISRPTTFEYINIYISRLIETCPKAAFILVGNKCDLITDIGAANDSMRKFAESYNALWYLTSAKTGENVETVFARLADLIVMPQNLS